MNLVLRLGINALAVWLAVRLVDGLTFTGDGWALVGIALVLAVVNAVVRPILKVLTFPAIILTLGLFLLVINAISLGIVAWVSGKLDLGFATTGFGATFLGALVVSIVTWFGEALSKRDDR